MRSLIILLICIPFSNGYSQINLQKTTSQKWAGGVCCSSGTNYSIALNMPKGTYEKLNIESICIEGRYFDKSELRINTIDRDTIVYLQLNFGFSNTGNEMIEMEKITIQESKNNCSTMGIEYKIGATKGFLSIDKIDELTFLAYP